MAVFKELDPQLHLKLVEGYEDVLSAEHRRREAFLQANRKCRRCGNSMVKELDTRVAWTSEDALPRFLLRCQECGHLFDPETGLILDMGNAAKIPQPVLPQYKVKL